jgi:hypothetical protein
MDLRMATLAALLALVPPAPAADAEESRLNVSELVRLWKEREDRVTSQ